jgi:GntP family gluconate:H+ symporter
MAHSLVPPTPGPLLVAEEIGVDIGAMMLGGLAVGLFTITFGYLYARRASGKFDLEPPPLVDGVSMDEEDLPSALVSFLPVILPVLLVTGGTLYAIFKPDNLEFLKVLGEKNLALGLAALVAFAILAKRCSGDKDRLRRVSSEALSSGAVIVLITAAGAAFGGVLKQTDIASAIGAIQGSATLSLPVCFLITALVRTAQGSATVAMITAAPVAAAFAASPALGFHPVYLALAVGCGSKPIPWMNDSGFWVVTRMSGLKESQTLRTVTPMMSLMGVTGLLVVIVASWVLPLS